MLKNLKKNSKGFTIIEVMIVLAIAGLILLIVFLAVPALQRNSRNTQRKSDVAAFLGAIQEQMNNNNGTIITDNSFFDNAKTSYYTTKANVTVTAYTTDTIGPNDVDKVAVYTKAKCIAPSADTSTKIIGAGTTRTLAVAYTIEQGGGNKLNLCNDS